MGARPLRRAIQRYIEDPLADEVLKSNLEPGSTVEVDKGEIPEGQKDPEVTIKITAPKKKRTPVGVGAKGEGGDDQPQLESGDGDGDGGSLPDDPEVLPDVPDAPPTAEASDETDK
jgi:ATP-dependent Clp protease ATP-binding subunit ClpC